MIRLAYFVSHPIQYQAPLLRMLATDPDITLKVFFYSDFSAKLFKDKEFGQLIKWDIPLLDGYEYQVLESWGSKRRKNFIQQPIIRKITEQLYIDQIDCVWVHGWSSIGSIQAILSANKLNIPILFRGETNGIEYLANPVKSWAKNIFLNWLFKKISRFLYIGTLNRQFYQSYGISEERLFPVLYAVDNDYFQKQAMLARINREERRRSLNLEPGRSIILYAAKLIEKKRPQDLLKAYRLLSPDGSQEPEPYLLFVGDGSLRSRLAAEAEATGWQSIRFLGFRNQSELPGIYDLSDVLVLPSSFEPWGLAVNEVMNAGKAVVVSDQVGCAPDLVLEGQNGRTFPVGDIEALADALRWAISNPGAGNISLQRIQHWNFQGNILGIKSAISSLNLGQF